MKNLTLITIIIFVIILLIVFLYWPKNSQERIIKKNNFHKIKSPELLGLTNWMNSEKIESIESLKGKVILVDFWTYSCINCIRTFPYLQDLQEKYADKGLIILGIHAPEFSFERKPENVAAALKKYGLTYPVALDNDFKTWRNFENRFWPAKYLIDKNGYIVYTHFGEGAYEETENKVRELLGLDKISKKKDSKIRKEKTPETYLGTDRRKNFIGKNFSDKLEKNKWTIFGNWKSDGQKIFSENISENNLTLKINILGAEANLVMGGDAGVEVFIDGNFYKKIEIKKNDLYNIFNFPEEKKYDKSYKEREVELKFSGKKIEIFAWTFG